MIICLNGAWDLYYGIEKYGKDLTLQQVKNEGWSRIEAMVPGNVEIDLCRAGIEEEPFYAENLYNFRKYEFHQWWFEKEFEVPAGFPDGDALLAIMGLDTFGNIWINGVHVAETDNMMLEYSIDITKHLIPGKNHIAIRIKSPINSVRDKEFPVSVKGAGWEHIDEMLWIRKPAHSFGWDIAPRLLSAGMWRDIYIVSRNRTYIKEVYFAVRNISESSANLIVRYRFATNETFLDGFSVRVQGRCGDRSFSRECKTKFCSDEVFILLDDVKLWWPRGYGEANLYDVTFELLYNGDVVDVRKERIGIRKIDIKTRFIPGDEGEFKVHVNGVPILCKGTNWVPLDTLHSRDADRLQKAHDLLYDVGCNMVRCWGGNVYEDHAFFDLCDERGIMVWQDFSLACGIYPQQDEFAAIMYKEASAVVKKLRNHPSIVLWSGDNEVDMMLYHFDYHLSHARYNRISREVLSGVVGSHDPFRYYLPSSPYIPENIMGDLNVPEQHNWGPRDYFKGSFYKHTTAHFISEIGYHGCPAISSIKKFISPAKLWPWKNDEWDTHNTEYIRLMKDRGYDRNQLMADQIVNFFGFGPENLEDFVLASQICQAEAKKFFIEMVRLKKWRRTGVIWWNLLDCWPQFSDAVVDYYLVRKLAYYYIRRVQQPVCIMVDEMENWSHTIVMGNDSCQDAWVDYTVEDGESGTLLLSGRKLSPANENVNIGTIKAYAGIHRLLLLKWEIDGRQYANHYVSAYPPIDFNRYVKWLEIIEGLPEAFKSNKCWL